ncbi:MAG: glycosyltransferase family 4 protein [Bacteroidales bacterium]|jgi:glycosyltransferase involved in cell wall biosynthesis|nr:glycosyltransferase family 4 protein [Bacteroidales bacterium]
MKILQLTHKPPVPCIDGGCLAMYQITSCLIEADAEVKVVSIATSKHPVIFSDENNKYFDITQFEAVQIDTNLKIIKTFSSFVKKTSLQADRFFSIKMVKKLENIFAKEKYDIVILESVFVGNYIETIRKHSEARIVLREHNIEYLIWERLSRQTINPIKKLAYRYLAKSLKNFELSLYSKIDGYMPITEVDHLFFKEKFPSLRSKVIPFCINLSEYPIQSHQIDENKITFFHIGSMNWQPNIEGMKWFLDKVWNIVSEKYPNVSLVLAGKGNKDIFGNCNIKNVQIFDFIENAKHFINEHDIMVVPLLAGSGMRIKIMEGLALGKPIITTTIGAEGINIMDNKNIFIANTPEEMVNIIEYCTNQVRKCEEVGRNARSLIESYYAQEKISKDLMEFLKTQI